MVLLGSSWIKGNTIKEPRLGWVAGEGVLPIETMGLLAMADTVHAGKNTERVIPYNVTLQLLGQVGGETDQAQKGLGGMW